MRERIKSIITFSSNLYHIQFSYNNTMDCTFDFVNSVINELEFFNVNME